MTPLGTDVTRNKYDWWGFGSPENSFWCCYGTTIESFGKLGDSVFFETIGGDTLYLMQPLVPSTVSWSGGTVMVESVENYDMASAPAVHVKIIVSSEITSNKSKTLVLRVRPRQKLFMLIQLSQTL